MNILITGGTSGIGFATAKLLIKQGHDVIITGQSTTNIQNAITQLENKVKGFQCNVNDLTNIDNLYKNLNEQNIQLDALFLNAGVFQPSSFIETTEEVFDSTMNINFKGAFFSLQKLLPLLKNPASVVFTSSIVTFKTFENASVYSASKSALESIVKVLNVELADKGIRVNILSPGITKTPILKKSGLSDDALDTLFSNLALTSPIKKFLEPNDIAEVACYLLSDQSKILRNENIVVDGGWTLT